MIGGRGIKLLQQTLVRQEAVAFCVVDDRVCAGMRVSSAAVVTRQVSRKLSTVCISPAWSCLECGNLICHLARVVGRPSHKGNESTLLRYHHKYIAHRVPFSVVEQIKASMEDALVSWPEIAAVHRPSAI